MAEAAPTTSGVLTVHDVASWDRVVAEWLTPLVIRAADDRPEFEASATRGDFGGVRLGVVSAGAHVAERTERLAAAGDPHYWLALQVEGHSSIEQAGHHSVLAPGDFAVYDSSMPYRRSFPGRSETLVVLIPQRRISLPPRALSLIAGLRIGADEGLGAIVSPFLTAVARNLDRLDGSQGSTTVHALIDLVTSAVAEKFGLVAPVPSARRTEEVMLIRDWIMHRLGDADLDPSTIAAAHFISTRQLHALFRAHGTTVGTWIRERRLDMARRDLEMPGEDDSIGDIARRWGFADAAYFARAFKQNFGTTPREFRRAAR